MIFRMNEAFVAGLTRNYGEFAVINLGVIDVVTNAMNLVSCASAVTWG